MVSYRVKGEVLLNEKAIKKFNMSVNTLMEMEGMEILNLFIERTTKD